MLCQLESYALNEKYSLTSNTVALPASDSLSCNKVSLVTDNYSGSKLVTETDVLICTDEVVSTVDLSLCTQCVQQIH